MRVAFLGGTGPVGQAAVPRLLAAGHDVAVAHSGAHEPPEPDGTEHLHGPRGALLAAGGVVEAWRPEVIVDTFAGGATATKARELRELALRADVAQAVAVSSIDVYRHCAHAGVGGFAPAELATDPLPLTESSPLRDRAAAGAPHDNIAMEAELPGAAPKVTVLRPGAIYGPHLHAHVLREWWLVERILRGERALPLPGGGTQLFHRVALDRVGRAVAAAVDRAPDGVWACNVADPYDWTFSGLATLAAETLGWVWEPREIPLADGDHPWLARHPVVADTSRLRTVLAVTDPDPHAATVAQLRWLHANADRVAAVPARGA